MFTDKFSPSEESELKEMLQKRMNGNVWFYLVYQGITNSTNFKSIISLSNNTRTLIQDVKFNRIGQIINNYDLEGMTIYSTTLSWAHYFQIKNCDEKGQNCETEGFLHDYMDALGRIG